MANLVLAMVGYIGIVLVVITLKKIERQARSAKYSATAAADHARSALLNAQAMIDSERPQLLITVEPCLGIANSFNVRATNRGRIPAQIVATAEQLGIVNDESHLPSTPNISKRREDFPLVSIGRAVNAASQTAFC